VSARKRGNGDVVSKEDGGKWYYFRERKKWKPIVFFSSKEMSFFNLLISTLNFILATCDTTIQ